MVGEGAPEAAVCGAFDLASFMENRHWDRTSVTSARSGGVEIAEYGQIRKRASFAELPVIRAFSPELPCVSFIWTTIGRPLPACWPFDLLYERQAAIEVPIWRAMI